MYLIELSSVDLFVLIATMAQHYNVVVVGAGVFGSTAAYNCQKLGLRTLLLEQFAFGHDNGSSHGKSRITRYAHAEEPYIPLVAEAYKELAKMEAITGTKLWKKTGLLWTDTKEGVIRVSEGLKKHNLVHDVMPGSEVSKKYPQFKFDDDTWALTDPEGGVLLADKILNAYQSELKNLGGVLQDREELIEYQEHEICINLKTSKGEYSADKLIITPGTWISKLVPQFEKLFRVEPESMTVLYWNAKNEKDNHLLQLDSFPSYIGKSTKHGGVFAMASVDYPNTVKYMCHHGQPYTVGEPHPESAEDVIKGPAGFITENVPVLDGSKPAIIERCKYTNSEDGHYVIDHLPGSKRIVIGACGSGAGFKVAPALGKVLAEIANDKKTSVDVSFFSLKRFTD